MPSDIEKHHYPAHANENSMDFPEKDASVNTLPAYAKANFEARQAELGKFFAEPVTGLCTYYQQNLPALSTSPSLSANDEAEIGTAAGSVSGLLFAWSFHAIALRYDLYQNKPSKNIFYRNLKTLFSVGFAFGALIASFLPLPDAGKQFISYCIASIGSLVLGAFAIPYWWIRQYVLNINSEENSKSTYSVTGDEGWSKFGKTLFVFGTTLGQLLGAAYSVAVKTPMAASIAIGSGIVGVGSFFLGLVMVPTINRISEAFGYGKILKADKDDFRNNYVRSGLTGGLTVGMAIGCIVGTFLLPGLGSILGATIGGAICSIAGGIFVGVKGHKISAYIKEHWNNNKQTDNGWDYATRTMSLAFAAVGTVIGLFVPLPGSTIFFANLFGAIGWALAFPVVRLARRVQPNETNAKDCGSLPWTQRTAYGINIGTAIGATIGVVIGLAGGPLGVWAMGTLCGAIGGIIGGLVKTLADKETRKTIKAFFVKPPIQKTRPVKNIIPSKFEARSVESIIPSKLKAKTVENIFPSRLNRSVRPTLPTAPAENKPHLKQQMLDEKCISNADAGIKKSASHLSKLGVLGENARKPKQPCFRANPLNGFRSPAPKIS